MKNKPPSEIFVCSPLFIDKFREKKKFSAKLTTWTNHSVWKLLKKGLILQHFTISQWPSQNMIQKLCFLPDFRSRRELCFLPLTKCTFSRQIAELSKFWLLSSSYRQNQNWNYRMSKIFLDLISIFNSNSGMFSFLSRSDVENLRMRVESENIICDGSVNSK